VDVIHTEGEITTDYYGCDIGAPDDYTDHTNYVITIDANSYEIARVRNLEQEPDCFVGEGYCLAEEFFSEKFLEFLKRLDKEAKDVRLEKDYRLWRMTRDEKYKPLINCTSSKELYKLVFQGSENFKCKIYAIQKDSDGYIEDFHRVRNGDETESLLKEKEQLVICLNDTLLFDVKKRGLTSLLGADISVSLNNDSEVYAYFNEYCYEIVDMNGFWGRLLSSLYEKDCRDLSTESFLSESGYAKRMLKENIPLYKDDTLNEQWRTETKKFLQTRKKKDNYEY